MSQFNNLPLQEMIRSVVSNATEKLASAQGTDDEVRAAMGHAPAGDSPEGEEDEQTITDPTFVEKLASACDFIAGNVDNIDTPNRGVLGAAIAKMAGEEMAPAVPTPEQLSVQAAMGGKQKYKHDKPKGEDAAASTANTPEGTAGLPGGATQMHNDMESAPGQNSGSVPTATYPAAGPLHAGPTKTAGLAALAAGLMEKDASKAGDIASAIGRKAKEVGSRAVELGKGGKKSTFAVAGKDSKGRARSIGKVHEGVRPGNVPKALLEKGTHGNEARKSLGVRAGGLAALGLGGKAAFGGKKKEKTAADVAREKILSKLAGEDVMKATVSSGKGGGALVGDGELQVMEAPTVPSNPTDGSGYGNQQRGMVASNEAATNYTKGDAKKPRAKELKEVLETPAFDPGADSKLREQLRNSGSAGVKIAGANSREIIKQAAANGQLTQETVNQFKELRKQAMNGPGPTAGGGMTAMAGEPPQNPKVQQLKEMMMARKEKESEVPGGQVPPPS